MRPNLGRLPMLRSLIRTPWPVVLGAASLLLLVASCGALVLREYRRLDPLPQYTTLQQFPRFLPEPYAIVRFKDNGTENIVVFGRQPLILFSEMPAGYLFDSTGTLMDWSVEATDVDRLNEFWSRARMEIQQGRQMTYEDIGVR